MVAYAFNPSTHETEAVRYMSSMSVWSAGRDPGQAACSKKTFLKNKQANKLKTGKKGRKQTSKEGRREDSCDVCRKMNATGNNAE